MTLNPKALEGGHFSFTYKDNKLSGLRLKNGQIEETWNTIDLGGGLFSDISLGFNTSGNNVIDPSSIGISTSGLRLGYSYTQNSVTMIDSDSFVVRGTVSWGIGVSGATFGYDEPANVRVDIDWNTGVATLSEVNN